MARRPPERGAGHVDLSSSQPTAPSPAGAVAAAPRSPLSSSLAYPLHSRERAAHSPFTADAQSAPDAQPRWQMALRHQWHQLAARGPGPAAASPGGSGGLGLAAAWGQWRPRPQGPADSRRCPFTAGRTPPPSTHPLALSRRGGAATSPAKMEAATDGWEGWGSLGGVGSKRRGAQDLKRETPPWATATPTAKPMAKPERRSSGW